MNPLRRKFVKSKSTASRPKKKAPPPPEREPDRDEIVRAYWRLDEHRPGHSIDGEKLLAVIEYIDAAAAAVHLECDRHGNGCACRVCAFYRENDQYENVYPMLESLATVIRAVVAEVNARREWPFFTKKEMERLKRDVRADLKRKAVDE